MSQKKSKEEPRLGFSLEEAASRSPEVAAHIRRLDALVPRQMIDHPRVQEVMHRQIIRAMQDLTLLGCHVRKPGDDLELMAAVRDAGTPAKA